MFCLGGTSKNAYFQFINFQMDFPVIWATYILEFSPTMVEYTAAFKKKKIQKNFWSKIKPYGLYGNMTQDVSLRLILKK